MIPGPEILEFEIDFNVENDPEADSLLQNENRHREIETSNMVNESKSKTSLAE